MRHGKASSVSAIAVPSAIERNKRKCKCHSCFRRNCAARWSGRPTGSMRGLRRFLVFLRLVMPNYATSGRAHQTMVAREVSGGAADDRTPFASTGIVVVAMTRANVLPRIIFMQELLSCQSNPWAVHSFLDHPTAFSKEGYLVNVTRARFAPGSFREARPIQLDYPGRRRHFQQRRRPAETP
jgi:hypothetical protein